MGKQSTHGSRSSVLSDDEVSTDDPERPAASASAAPRSRRRFGLKNSTGKNTATGPGLFSGGFNPYDYGKKYPEDPFCREAAPEARVWWTYVDVAGEYDTERVEGWKDTIDVLLIFAGLFSAIVTGFVIQAWQNVQTDYAQVSAVLLVQLISIQMAMANGSTPSPISPGPIPPEFDISPTNRWVNILWFTSLSLSIATALIAMVTKQWLDETLSFYRPGGWKVPFIIDLLPFLMHLALALFLAGLVLFLLPLNQELPSICGIIAGLTYMLYVVSVLLPIFRPQCPYQTPLTNYAHFMYTRLPLLFHGLVRQLDWFSRHRNRPNVPPAQAGTTPAKPSSLRDAERVAIFTDPDGLQLAALVWLYNSSNITAQELVIESLGGLQIPPGRAFPESWERRLHRLLRESMNPRKVERLCQSRLAMDTNNMVYPRMNPSADDSFRLLGYLANQANPLTTNTTFDLAPDELLLSFLSGKHSTVQQHPAVFVALFNRLLPMVAQYKRNSQLIQIFVEMAVETVAFRIAMRQRATPPELYSTTLAATLQSRPNCACEYLSLTFLNRTWDGQADPTRQSFSLICSMLEWLLEAGNDEITPARRIRLLNLLINAARPPEQDPATGSVSPNELLVFETLFVRLISSPYFVDPLLWNGIRVQVLWKMPIVTPAEPNRLLPTISVRDDAAAEVILRNVVRLLHNDDLINNSFAYMAQQIFFSEVCCTSWMMHHLDIFRQEDLFGAFNRVIDRCTPHANQAYKHPLDRFSGLITANDPEYNHIHCPPLILGVLRSVPMSQEWSDYVYQPSNLVFLCKLLVFARQSTKVMELLRHSSGNLAWHGAFVELIEFTNNPFFSFELSYASGPLPITPLYEVLTIIKAELGFTSPEFSVPDSLQDDVLGTSIPALPVTLPGRQPSSWLSILEEMVKALRYPRRRKLEQIDPAVV